MNNPAHYVQEKEPSPTNPDIHWQGMRNKFQIQQAVLHEGGLSRSNSLQPQHQQLSLPVHQQRETSNGPLEGEVAHADPAYSQNQNGAKVRSKTKTDKQIEKIKALQEEIRHLEKEHERNKRRRRKKNKDDNATYWIRENMTDPTHRVQIHPNTHSVIWQQTMIFNHSLI